MASNISVESGKELHSQLIAALMGKIFVDWSGYNTLLVLLRGHGFSDRDIAECRKSEATLFEHLELKGLIEEGKYGILLKVLKGLNEPAIQLIKSYQVKFEAISHKEDAGQKRRHENDEPVPSCSKVQKTEQVNKVTSTTSLRVRSKAEDRTLKRMHEQRESKTFVPTQAVTKGQSLLKNNKIAIFSGLAGDGKTENALFIMNQLWLKNPDAIYIKMDSISEWQHVDPNVESVVLLDDCLGKTNGDTGAINNTEKWKDIYSCIKHGKIRLIMTIRQHIYIKYCTKLENAGIELFMKRNVIDMTNEEFCLPKEIKGEMLLKHCQSRNIEIVSGYTFGEGLKLGTFIVNRIVQSNSVIGFPYTCFLFCCHSKYTKQGAKFFEKPLEILKKDIDDLANSKTKDERIQYCLMSYMLLNGGRINLKNMNHELFDNVVKSLGINSPTERERKEAIELLNHRFIVGEYPWFSFKHQTINECVALSFKDDNISLLLQTCSLAFISEVLRPANYKKVEGEECIILQADDYRNVVQRLSESLRIIDEVDMIIRWWTEHPLMDDCGFVDLFVEVLKSNESCREFIKDGSTFLDACYLGKTFLIDRLYNTMDVDMREINPYRCFNKAIAKNHIDTVMWLLEKFKVDVDYLLLVKSCETMLKIINHEKVGYAVCELVLTNSFGTLLHFVRTCWNYEVVLAILHQWPDIDRKQVLKLLFALIICNDEKSIDVILSRRPDVVRQQEIENILTVSCLAGSNKTLELILNNSTYSLSQNTVEKMFVLTYATGHKKLLNSFLNFKLKEISEDIRNLHVLAYLGEFEVFMKLINIGMNIKSKSETDKSLLMYTIKGYKRVFKLRGISKKIRRMVQHFEDCNLSDIIYFIEHIIQEMDDDATTGDDEEDVIIPQGTSDYRMILNYLMQTDNAKEVDIIPQGTSDYRMIFNYLMQTDNANLTDLNMILDKHGSTVAHYCVLFKDIQTLTLIENTYRNVLSSKTCDGVSCLHVAALFGNYDVFKLLAEAGLSIKERDALSRSVLQYAMIGYVFASKCHWEGINSCKHILSYYSSLRKFYERPEKDDLKQLLGFLIQNEDVCLTDLDMEMDRHGSTIAHFCVFLNDTQTLDVIANRYKSVLSSKTFDGVTCLHMAALLDRNDVFMLLVKAGLSLKEKDAFSRSVLQYAMIGYVSAFYCHWEGINSCKHILSYYSSLKRFDKHPEKDDLKQLLGFLIQNEDVCLTDLDMEMDRHGSTIAHFCVFLNDTQTLDVIANRYKSVLSSKTFDGVTCLHVAAISGRNDVFKLLVKAGLSLKEKDAFSISVLQYAMIGYVSAFGCFWERIISCKHILSYYSSLKRFDKSPTIDNLKQLLGFLIQNKDVGLTDLDMEMDTHGSTIAHLCVVFNDVQTVNILVKRYDSVLLSATFDGVTCLHVAALYGRYDLFLLLVKTGLSIKDRDKFGISVLQYAIIGYCSVLDLDLKKLFHKNYGSILLLEYFEWHRHEPEREGYIHEREGYRKILELLIQNEDVCLTDLNMVIDPHGTTIAHCCVVLNDVQILDLLAKKYINILYSKTYQNMTCFHIAAFFCRVRIIETLVQTGLEITETNDLGRNLLQCVLVSYRSMCLGYRYRFIHPDRFKFEENKTKTEDIDTNVDTSVNCANDESSGMNTGNNDHNMTSLKLQEHGKRIESFCLKYSTLLCVNFGNVSDYTQTLLLLVNHGISTDLDIILDTHGCTLAHYCVVNDNQATIDLLQKACPSVLSKENFNKVKPIDLAVFLGRYKTFQKLYCSQQNTEELNKILLKGKQYKQYCVHAIDGSKLLNFLDSLTYISWGNENDYDAIEQAINKYVV